MSEISPALPVKASRPVRFRFLSRLWNALSQNPVVLKELRSRMRGGRAHLIISIYLALLSLLVGLVYLVIYISADQSVGGSMGQTAGKTVFAVVVVMEMMMVCFIAPALTSGAIAAERERQTYDLLRVTLLPSSAIVVGKLTSAMSFLVLLLLVGFPIQSLAFLFGGISIEEVLIAFVMLIVTALTFCSIGLFISSLLRSTLVSTVVSYVSAILVVFGSPTLISIALSLFGIVSSFSATNWTLSQQLVAEVALVAIGYFLIAINPLAAAIATEIMITATRSSVYTTLPLSNNYKFPIIGPWIAFCLLYLLLSLFLIWLSVRRVRKNET